MKTFLKLLCAFALMLPFAACDPEEGNPGGNNGNDDNNGLTIEQVTGTWQSTHIMVNDEDMTVEMRITMSADGTGYLDDPNDVFHYTLSGMNVVITPPNGSNSYTFTVESITATEMVMSGSVIPGTDQQVSFKGWFTKVEGGDNPGGDDPSDDAWVDLGLPSGLLWASCNVGATSPEQFGNYYAWGETQPKEIYNWVTYIWCTTYETSLEGFTKYNNSDHLTVLVPGDDAATANIGNGARTPLFEEWEELVANTTYEWTSLNGINGIRLIGANGKSIFLPAAGVWGDEVLAENCSAWSASLEFMSTGEPSGGAHCFVYFPSIDYITADGHAGRCEGLPVRPVRDPQK